VELLAKVLDPVANPALVADTAAIQNPSNRLAIHWTTSLFDRETYRRMLK
jgi:hypothetical protein